MGLGRIHSIRRPLRDVRAGDNQARPGRLGLCCLDSARGGFTVLAINVLNMPAVSLEAFAAILREGEVCGTLDGDAVVIIDVDQVAQAQMAGQRSRLRRHTFHQVAVRDDSIDIVVDDPVLGGVVAGGGHLGRDGHAHTV